MTRPVFKGFAAASELEFNDMMSVLCLLMEQNYRDLKQMWILQVFARRLKVK